MLAKYVIYAFHSKLHKYRKHVTFTKGMTVPAFKDANRTILNIIVMEVKEENWDFEWRNDMLSVEKGIAAYILSENENW